MQQTIEDKVNEEKIKFEFIPDQRKPVITSNQPYIPNLREPYILNLRIPSLPEIKPEITNYKIELYKKKC